MVFETQLLKVATLATAVLLIAAQPVVAQTMALPGKFGVSTSGAATYTIPIAVPPGTAGVVPSLSLEYSSHDGDGIMGIGWSLAGLPSIGRCPKTLAQDGVRWGVNYDSGDHFCLDGQRLVNISGSGGDSSEYRTGVESYSRIISHGNTSSGPGWFEVHTKTGQIMELGHSADSLILAQGRNAARKWALNKVSDTKGNYFTISYTNDAANGQFYPSEINYTGNSAAGLNPYNKVQFFYTTRPDITSTYQDITGPNQAGSLVRVTQLLTNVKTFAGGALVGDYRITYQQNVNLVPVSRVATITLCAADGACVPATSFSTTGAGNGTFVSGSFQFPNGWDFGYPPQASWMLITGDFNGDGKSDFAMLLSTQLRTLISNGDGTFTEGTFAMPAGWDFGNPAASLVMPISGDFNGDGKSDFALLLYNRVYTFLSNGDGTFVPNINWFPAGCDFGPAGANWMLIQGDFDGDGRSDFALVQDTKIFTFFSTGDGSFTGSFTWLQNGMSFGNPAASAWTLITGDFNGDGKSDFALLQGANLVTFTSFSSGGWGNFSPAVYSIPNGWNYGSPPHASWIALAGDFNGDGKSDFAMLQGTHVQTFLSKGDGSFIASNFDLPTTFGNPPQTWWMPASGDFNGDGKTDFALLSDSFLFAFLSKGDGSFAWAPQPTPWSFGSPPTSAWMFVPGDFSGDGKADITMVRGNSVHTFSPNSTPFHLLSSVINGLGATTAISYAPITNSSVYTKDQTATYPVQDVQNSLRAVSRVDASNGIGGNYSTSYTYAGAKVDPSWGFLGFRRTVATDLQTNIVQTTNLRQDFPFIGMLDSATKTRNGQTLNHVVNTYQVQDAGGAARTWLSQSIESNWDLDGTAMPTTTKTFQYDAYNNATQVSVATSDGYSKTTNNTYTNDTANWLLGRLNSSTVTSQAPRQQGQ